MHVYIYTSNSLTWYLARPVIIYMMHHHDSRARRCLWASTSIISSTIIMRVLDDYLMSTDRKLMSTENIYTSIVVKIPMLVCATGFFPPCENLFLIVLWSVKSNFLPHRSERKLWSPKMGAMLRSRNTTLKHNSEYNCIQNHSLNMGSHASNGSNICVRVVTKSCVCKRFAKMAPNHFRYFGWIPAYMPCVLIWLDFYYWSC